MTTHTELLEIVNNGENSGVEFKRDTGCFRHQVLLRRI